MYLSEHEDRGSEGVGQHEVDGVEVLCEAIQNAAGRRRLEEAHRRAHQRVCSQDRRGGHDERVGTRTGRY